jgi:acyl dehydratase
MSEHTGVNPDLAGRVYPAGEAYTVGREKIREFARAVKAAHPAHYDVDAARALGYADLVAPPTFAIIVAQRADAQLVEDPEAGIDFSRVVHAEQRFVHHRPIVAGDERVAELHVDQVRAMGGGAMITTRAEISTVDGEQTATTTSSILVRGEGQ